MIKVRFVYFYNGSPDGEEHEWLNNRQEVIDQLPTELRTANPECHRIDAWEVDENGYFIGECIDTAER